MNWREVQSPQPIQSLASLLRQPTKMPIIVVAFHNVSSGNWKENQHAHFTQAIN